MHIVKSFFNRLEADSINYVHFKSNKNLDVSFAGKGDFDILVDKYQINKVEQILLALNAKRYNKVKYGIYPGVDNWLLYDNETGKLHHIHLHYQIVSGKQYLKDYVIPWEDIIFETRVSDEQFGIYVSHPCVELLLLTVRSVIKSRFSDVLKALLFMYKLHPSLQEERKHLLSTVSKEELESFAERIFMRYDKIVKYSMMETWNSLDYLRVSNIIRKEMKVNRRLNAISSCINAVMLKIGDSYNKVLRRYFDTERIEKKTTLSGGRIIAFVGVDGAGKSTTKDVIYKWMKGQIECKRFYMGTGDGKVNLLAKVLKKANNSMSSSGSHNTDKIISFRKKPIAYLKKVMAAIMVYSVEKDNYKKLLRMNRYRINGGVCLLDRYPQIEIEGQNDGPKIGKYISQIGNNKLLVYLQKKEMKLLRIVTEIKPDLVIRLNISAETSMERKPEQKNIDGFRKKIEELNSITFQNARIVDVNAEQPYESEIMVVKDIIWEQL